MQDTKVEKTIDRTLEDRPSRQPAYKQLDQSTQLEVLSEESAVVRFTLEMYKLLAGQPYEAEARQLVDKAHVKQMQHIEDTFFSSAKPTEQKWVKEGDTQAFPNPIIHNETKHTGV